VRLELVQFFREPAGKVTKSFDRFGMMGLTAFQGFINKSGSFEKRVG